uniref:Uncharacterized protein n=1 Tax=Chromera velia CCMP2878 TaxID=1169474 RepID=A0A0G4HYU6_9ALVE|eukprot:Cvel_9575.t1-p1 / transcript=Cvel_9575.t1 / gene=Cvel_9575 / organism=Chromera_velia_CCMP2878 / gene_product=hypothetical protein / transcript_product=hypothetical protein / location=Cvel_scaffold555:35637-35837(-) / protein_length=67 / sequence_SO=supercontig / SO=protein_coding / is_pseudo=false
MRKIRMGRRVMEAISMQTGSLRRKKAREREIRVGRTKKEMTKVTLSKSAPTQALEPGGEGGNSDSDE